MTVLAGQPRVRRVAAARGPLTCRDGWNRRPLDPRTVGYPFMHVKHDMRRAERAGTRPSFGTPRDVWSPSGPLNHEMMPGNTIADAEKWAADIAGPAYAIDDQTAIKVTDGIVEVVSEGQWKQLS